MIGKIIGGIGSAVGGIAGLLGGGSSGGDSGFDWGGWAQKEISSSATDSLQVIGDALIAQLQREQPWEQEGLTGLKYLTNFLASQSGLTPQDMVSGLPPGAGADLTNFLTQSMPYQFIQGEGEKGVMRQLAARGLLGSGTAPKAISRYNQGLASTYALPMLQQNYQNYLKNYLQNVSGLADRGQVSTGRAGNYLSNWAQGLANVQMQEAQLQSGLVGTQMGQQLQQNALQSSTDYFNQENLLSSIGSIGKGLTNALSSVFPRTSSYGTGQFAGARATGNIYNW